MKESEFIEIAVNLTDSVGVTPLLSSEKSNWKQVFLAYYQHPGAVLDTHTVPFHCLESIDYGSSHHLRRIGERYSHQQVHGGEFFVCPANTDHSITWTEHLNFSLLVFNPLMFKQQGEELEISKPIEFIPQLHISNTWLQEVINVLKIDLKNGCPDGSLYGQEIIEKLTKCLIENYTAFNPKISQQIGKLPKPTLKEVLEYIDTNLEQDFDLQNLADVAHYSKYHFLRSFETSTGMTPCTYRSLRRIERSQILLKTTSDSIASIATQCGFSNSKYFSKEFKRKTGINPRKFREQCKYVQIII
ncbi:MAG: AraC family transcriptional regulator [Nostocales cyanobacterium]|nr:MAG: AraC family transcriptional regulator [Nostocales cyanobacterium]TAF08328.1 MAG: AraC family transcriptional regulator [Nostocales cyanobacterium]